MAIMAVGSCLLSAGDGAGDRAGGITLAQRLGYFRTASPGSRCSPPQPSCRHCYLRVPDPWVVSRIGAQNAKIGDVRGLFQLALIGLMVSLR